MGDLLPGAPGGDPGWKLRLDRLGMATTVIVGLLLMRLWYLQVMRGPYFASLAERNRMRLIPVSAPRGLMLDRNGRTLVQNRLSFTLSVIPEEVRAASGGPEGEAGFIAELAKVLGLPQEQLWQQWSEQSRRYRFDPLRLVRNLTDAQLLAIEERRSLLPGVVVEQEPSRHYPMGSTAAHVVGYLLQIDEEELKRLGDQGYRGSDLIGKSGLERAYESYLRGREGFREIEVDAQGRFRRLVREVPAEPGLSLRLTLDASLQKVTEQALVRGIERAEERRRHDEDPQVLAARPVGAGAAVVLDAHTGGVLAMASFPSFDPGRMMPNALDRELYLALTTHDRYLPQINRAIQAAYAPGSVFKVITGIAALEEGKWGANEELRWDGGDASCKKEDWMLRSGLRPPPNLDIVKGFEWSSNDFFWNLGDRVGIDSLAEWARRFGLGRSVGIDLAPGDTPGFVPDRAWKATAYTRPDDRLWYRCETLDVAIGQGALQVTPLQVAAVYMAIANNGVAYRPHLVEAVLRPDGSPLVTFSPQVLFEVRARPGSWELVRRGLWNVVNGPGGTARSAFRSGDIPVSVAGKTGTAQVSGTGQLSHAWFAGMAPADSPEVVVVVFVENGGGGAAVAAPIAHDILRAYFAGVAPGGAPRGQAPGQERG